MEDKSPRDEFNEGIVLGGVEQSFDYRRIAGKNFGAVYFPFFFFRA